MAQLSRPFQIALVAVLLLAGIWLFALQGHSASTSNSGSSAPVSAAAPAASAPAGTATAQAPASRKTSAVPTHVSHGSGSSLGGLSRAVNRAKHAAAISQQNTKQLQEKAAQASNEASTHSSSAPTRTPAVSPTASTSAPAATATTVKQQPIKAQSGAGRTPARQLLVERALKEGKIAVILFWNPKGAEDAIVGGELRLLEAVHHLIRPLAHTVQLRQTLKVSGLELEKRFAAFVSPASQVASYGSITRGVQVYATPTLFVINKRGQTTVLTGLQDAFSIEQAIDEARNS